MFVGGRVVFVAVSGPEYGISARSPPPEGILKRGSRTNLSVLVRAFVAEETKNQVLASNLH